MILKEAPKALVILQNRYHVTIKQLHLSNLDRNSHIHSSVHYHHHHSSSRFLLPREPRPLILSRTLFIISFSRGCLKSYQFLHSIRGFIILNQKKKKKKAELSKPESQIKPKCPQQRFYTDSNLGLQRYNVQTVISIHRNADG